MTRQTFRLRLAAGATVIAALGSMFASGATPAVAAGSVVKVSDNCDIPGMGCTEGDLYINYHSVAVSGQGNPSGSFASFYGNIYDHEGTAAYQGSTLVQYTYVFAAGEGDGSGKAVKNNSASANNCSEVDGYRVYYNSGYAGHSQSIPHYFGCGSSTNLDGTLKNQNASSHFA